jgi:hypothetical protein
VLSFEPVSNSEYDPNAVKIIADNKHIGHVNRAQTLAFRHWLGNNNIKAYVEKKTLKDYELSRMFMFIEVT